MIDAIFCISLRRLDERRKNAIKLLSDIYFAPVYFFDAIDGNPLEWEDFYSEGFHEYKNFQTEDTSVKFPDREESIYMKFWDREVTKGEMGCGISHYLVWKKAVEMNFSEILILEDDISFELGEFHEYIDIYSNFKKNNEYDIFYFGGTCYWNEPFDEHINRVFYKYTTHAYTIKKEAMQILVDSNYLSNIIAVDEFLITFYMSHPRSDLQELYRKKRELIAYSFKKDIILQFDQGGSQTEPS